MPAEVNAEVELVSTHLGTVGTGSVHFHFVDIADVPLEPCFAGEGHRAVFVVARDAGHYIAR